MFNVTIWCEDDLGAVGIRGGGEGVKGERLESLTVTFCCEVEPETTPVQEEACQQCSWAVDVCEVSYWAPSLKELPRPLSFPLARSQVSQVQHNMLLVSVRFGFQLFLLQQF